jgi:hypothetical protein
MSAVGLESIDHTVQRTHIWINQLEALLGQQIAFPSACCGRSCRHCATGCRSARRWTSGRSFRCCLRGRLLRALAAGGDARQGTSQGEFPRPRR